MVAIQNPAAKLDHAKREIVTARFFESPAADAMNNEEKSELIQRLHAAQNGLCYVCSEVINLRMHQVDVDHIRALSRGGVDDEQNWALTHARCNRSRGTRDLQLQRILHRFEKHVESHSRPDTEGTVRNFTVNQALDKLYPERQEVGAVIKGGTIQISFNLHGEPQTEQYDLIDDPANPGFPLFVGMIPFVCLHHEPTINPRSAVDLEPTIEEF